MKNIFITGKPVSGESMIGYKRYTTELLHRLAAGNNVAVHGLRRMGKTSVVQAAIRELRAGGEGDQLILAFDLAKFHSFEEFLESMAESVFDWIDAVAEVPGENTDALADDRVISIYRKKLENTSANSMRYRNLVGKVFQRLKLLQVSSYLVIDEFDAALTLFEHVAEFEFLRDLSANLDISLQLVLVSRRRLYQIERQQLNCSTLDGIMTTMIIHGFERGDVAEFYDILSRNYGVEPDEEQRKRIAYYAGRSPFIYSMFGYSIAECAEKDFPVDLVRIYKSHEIDIQNHYKSVFDMLVSDEIRSEDRLTEVSTVNQLMGILIGPSIGITYEQVQYLQRMNYLYEEGGRYYSISEYFSDYLRNQDYKSDSWDLLISTERKLKLMVRRHYQNKTGVRDVPYETWCEALDQIGAEQTIDMYDSFIESADLNFHKEMDLLDAVSIGIVVDLIRVDWETVFSSFFHHDKWGDWEYKFSMCAKARNPFAHGHSDLLTVEEVNTVNEYCKEILKILQNSRACDDTEVRELMELNRARKEARRRYYDDTYTGSVEPEMVGETVSFTCAVRKKKSMSGFFLYHGTMYKGSISMNQWKEHFPDVTPSDYLGKEISVKIEAVNHRQNAVTLAIAE